MQYRTPAFLVVFGALLAGCDRPRPATVASVANSSSAIRERALREFALADYYKPLEGGGNEHDVRLAPLIVLEAPEGRPPNPSTQPMLAVRILADNQWKYDSYEPALYFVDGVARLRAGALLQKSFLWCYSRMPAPEAHVIRWRGIRMTLDSHGAPVIWEAFADHDTTIVMFIARSLENKAWKRFGNVFEGRKFAVERPVRDQPNVVVARILEDGPEAMGPFVYVNAERDTITTLLCRCMPSQFSNVAETYEYRLTDLASLAGLSPRKLPWPSTGWEPTLPSSVCDLVPTVPDCSRPDWLDLALRLPLDF